MSLIYGIQKRPSRFVVCTNTIKKHSCCKSLFDKLEEDFNNPISVDKSQFAAGEGITFFVLSGSKHEQVIHYILNHEANYKLFKKTRMAL